MRFTEIKINEAVMNVKDLMKRGPERLDALVNILKAGNQATAMKGGKTFKPDASFYKNPANVENLKKAIEAEWQRYQSTGRSGPFKLVGFVDDSENAQEVDSNQLEKFTGVGTRASSVEDLSNVGELAEALHACAVYARLINGTDPISINDVANVISKIDNGKKLEEKSQDVKSKEFDVFSIQMNINPDIFAEFKRPDILEHPKVQGVLNNAIIPDANDNTGEYADKYKTNGEFDRVDIVGDGITNQKGTKADIEFRNKVTGKIAKFSLKANTTRELHQVGGGKMDDPIEIRYKILEDFFNEMGVDISGQASKFVEDGDIFKGYITAYQEAIRKIGEIFQGEFDKPERVFMSNFLKVIKQYAIKQEDGMDVKQFTSKGYYVLDMGKLETLANEQDFNLTVEYTEGRSKEYPEIALPKIQFKTPDEKLFLQIRMYIQRTAKGPYIRNKVEKGPAFVALTVKKTNIK